MGVRFNILIMLINFAFGCGWIISLFATEYSSWVVNFQVRLSLTFVVEIGVALTFLINGQGEY